MGAHLSSNINAVVRPDTGTSGENNITIYNYDLKQFERYYLDTLIEKFLQKSEKIALPTTAFSGDENVFVNLNPWTNVSHFGTFCHTMIGYGVRFRNPADSLYLNTDLAANLYAGIVQLFLHLPYPAPVNQAPWGAQADWYHFSITMPECVQNTCIVLRGFYDLDVLCVTILDYYLPAPTFSMGWRRTAGNAMRMCLPYCYGQLLRGNTFRQIAAEPEVQYVLNLVAFPLVHSGNGIHSDYAYFDHTDVRAYGYLINSYFTFSYYNFMFGDNTVNMANLYNSVALISNSRGLANPAVMARNGSHFSNVLGYFIEYTDGVVSADFSKILTIRNNRYFGSVVGQAPEIAYYEADPTNETHAPLWTMTRKIWANNGAIIRYRPDMLGIESGILLMINLNGVVSIPTTTTSTSSFRPTIARTALCRTDNAGVMAMHVKLKELNVEFHSYTLYHRYGMFHLYDKITALTPVAFNPRCVVLTRDTQQDTGEAKWTTASNFKSYNGVTAKHHNIVNNSGLSNFVLRNLDAIGMQAIEQIMSADAVNRGVGVACFSLLTQDVAEHDSTNVSRLDNNVLFVSTNQNSIQCVVAFPIVILKDSETRQVVINNAANTSRGLHTLDYDVIDQPLSYLSLTINNLNSNYITKSETSFTFYNNHSNQFSFTY
ncbi:occlusion-derived virus envelope protein 66b [Orgyia leucostigma nucleopolyhedrovirus]|uniref:Occlusion-derived virus envelope protein 66b n=1 Tax=Orgyia leucostigma nucleopolyhedrovirus TaxID=490711 RepID=B0FDY7_9ABAC|nr:occlusion-derived virus envelope protein 66b [Orgyia leucostigma nucleopolyhedrovirus]ABY65845.1 occlusion-derived virus envelope protein 66b [Orgyia leucostigma nucleopolyhedrovirus]